MANTKKPMPNPFYVILVIAGVIFCITACAYGTMTLLFLHPESAEQADASRKSFLSLVDQHGLTAMVVELIVLALATVAAIATDDYWQRKSNRIGDEKQGNRHES
ncbi:MAG: hypothetical protein R3E01_28000 [Pirellulaceae bacterium]|nr:hypothetical protein [Planctomycetales bacterium]